MVQEQKVKLTKCGLGVKLTKCGLGAIKYNIKMFDLEHHGYAFAQYRLCHQWFCLMNHLFVVTLRAFACMTGLACSHLRILIVIVPMHNSPLLGPIRLRHL